MTFADNIIALNFASYTNGQIFSEFLVGTNLSKNVSGGIMYLTWPPNQIRWTLQSNSSSLANQNDWVNIIGPDVTNSAITTVNSAAPNVLYRHESCIGCDRAAELIGSSPDIVK